jgi:hypothetical protein
MNGELEKWGIGGIFRQIPGMSDNICSLEPICESTKFLLIVVDWTRRIRGIFFGKLADF